MSALREVIMGRKRTTQRRATVKCYVAEAFQPFKVILLSGALFSRKSSSQLKNQEEQAHAPDVGLVEALRMIR